MGKKYEAPPEPNYEALLQQTNLINNTNKEMMHKYLTAGARQMKQQRKLDYATLRSTKRLASAGLKRQDRALGIQARALEDQKKTQNRILGVMLPAMKDEARAARVARRRYEREGIPYERGYLRELKEWDSPKRRAREAAEAGADVRTAFEAGQTNEERRLEALGLDPSQVRSASHMAALEGMNSAEMAGAGNRARRRVEAEGLALGGEAVNIYRGLPAQTAQAYATSQGAAGVGGGAAGGYSAAAGNFAGNNVAGAGSWLGAGSNLIGAAGQAGRSQTGMVDLYRGTNDFSRTQGGVLQAGWGTANSIYGNQLMGAQNEAAARAAPFSALGNIAGMAAGGFLGREEGGPIPREASPSGGAIPDDVPTATTVGEYVLPEDVVRWVGEEKLGKMIEKSRKDRGAIPTGAGNG